MLGANSIQAGLFRVIFAALLSSRAQFTLRSSVKDSFEEPAVAFVALIFARCALCAKLTLAEQRCWLRELGH